MSALQERIVDPFNLPEGVHLFDQLKINMASATEIQNARLWVGVLREKARKSPPGPDRVAELRTQFENRWPRIYNEIMTGWYGWETPPSILKLTYGAMGELEQELKAQEESE